MSVLLCYFKARCLNAAANYLEKKTAERQRAGKQVYANFHAIQNRHVQVSLLPAAILLIPTETSSKPLLAS